MSSKNVSSPANDHIQELANKSKKNRAEGKEDVQVSLKDKKFVRFTSNYGFMKAGDEQFVSQMAYDIYSKAGVVEVIN